MANGFETEFTLGPVALEGAMSSLVATDDIIRLNEDWKVTLKWSLWGDALDPNSAVGLKDGTWVAHTYLERIGAGAASEIDIGPVNVLSDTFDPPAAPDPARLHERVFTAEFDVNNAGLGVTTGVYRIAATITYNLEDSGTPARMAGFIEGGIVQIYEAPAP